MSSCSGLRRIPVGAEVALAFTSAAASFTVLALVLTATDSDFLAVVLGVVAVAAIVAVARFAGAAYAIPMAVAGLVAYDWYAFPPTHPGGFPDTDNLLSLLVYFGVGTFAGEIAAYAVRRAEVSEAARRELAGEQAALRRVATLVANNASQETVFRAIAAETAQLLHADQFWVLRYENGQSATVVASSREHDMVPVGARQTLGGNNIMTRVKQTGKAARIDDFSTIRAPTVESARAIGVRGAVGAPIVVAGEIWGVILAATTSDQPLPPESATRLTQFTDLFATAIANAESQAKAGVLADEQLALRRVATLVAKEATPDAIFAKVADEASHLLGADCALIRNAGDGSASVVAASGGGVSAAFPVGTAISLEGDGVTQSVLREGRSHRIDAYSATADPVAEGARERGISSAVGCPILAGERTWGAIVVVTFGEADPCPPETETRLAQFADLVATAIGNAEARRQVEQLAEEQAALRRVATLVAEGGSPMLVFDAVTAEISSLLDPDGVLLARYEGADEITTVAHRGSAASSVPIGTTLRHDPRMVSGQVWRTGAPARVEPAGTSPRGVRTAVGAPVVVDGRLWGVAIAYWQSEQSPRIETEERMGKFAQLLETAIANADSRDQLTASRARLLTAADDARRRVVRDLHDGAQQRLVHSIISLRLAKTALGRDDEAAALVDEALEQAEQGSAELRELAHGILPSVLTRGGLQAAVDTVVARLELPVVTDIANRRFSAELEASAYFIVAEALTNIVKHARAGSARVSASVEGATLYLEVHDDGIGGADPAGHGLLGLRDRATALGGRLDVLSPPDGGTLLTASLPLSPGEAERGAESGDDRAGERDGRERVEEAGFEEARTKPGQRQ